MTIPQFHWFDTVESTNDIALDMARQGEPEGTVVVAKRQLKGRGRRGRVWVDEPGQCVLMSMIVTPDIPLDQFHQLSFIASLSVLDSLDVVCNLNNISLKWPNDVFVNGKKIAGILVEVTHYQNKPIAVIGIGVNLLQNNFSLDISNIATSVKIESGQNYEVDYLANCIAGKFFEVYQTFFPFSFEEILVRWRKYIWGIGRHANIEAEGQTFRGEISGVDSAGALLIRDTNGVIRAIQAADAIHLDMNLTSQEDIINGKS